MGTGQLVRGAAMRAVPVLVFALACGSTPEPLPLPTPTGPALAAPVWLVQAVTSSHVRLAEEPSTPPPVYVSALDDADDWTLKGAAAHVADAGHDAPGAIVLGDADGSTPRVEVSHEVEVPERTRCTVSAWVKTQGLAGERLVGGASLEVQELGTPAKKPFAQKEKTRRHDHLPRLRGDVPWTQQSMTIETGSGTTHLAVVLSGGRGSGAGQAWFDDVEVTCQSPLMDFLAARPVQGGQTGALVGRVRIDRVDRPALLAPAPSSWAVEVDRSVDQVLRTTVGLDEASPKGSRACFTITVDGAEQASACRNAGQGWERLKVELPAAPGETSTVGFSILQTETGAGGVALGAWGDPSLDPVTWPGERPPDITLVIFDTLRADDLGVGGNTARPVSPVLDALAAEGTWFAQARSPTSWTLPSTATLLTGVTPPTHGAGWRIRREVRHRGKANDSRRRLDYAAVSPDVPRVGERLRDQGYRTAMMASNHYLDRRFGFASGFGTYGDYAGSSLPGGRRALGELGEIIDDDRDGAGRPLFLVLHMLEPHLPYRMRAPIPEGFELPDVFEYEEQSYAGMTSQTLRKVGPTQEKHPEALKVMHQADTRYGDDVLGEYLEMLGGDAMVLFTSDHGEAFGEHGEFLHGDDMFDETLHVPMIVRWPGGAHAGTTVETPVSLEEAAATLVAAGGGSLEGLEAAPLPQPGTPEDPNRVQYFEHIYKGYDRVGVLRGTLKRIRTLPTLGIDNRARRGQAGATLFDIRADPGERTDLSETRPDDAAALDALIAARIDATFPGVHLDCPGPHPALTIEAEQAFVRGVPLGGPEVTVSEDQRTLTVPQSDGEGTRLVVEAAAGAPISVSPLTACKRWEVAIPEVGGKLDQDQLDQLEAIGYVE